MSIHSCILPQATLTITLRMSPLSDIYSSSIHEGEVINSLPYLQSDDLSTFPSEPTASQQTVTSNTDGTDLSFTQCHGASP